MRLRKMVLVAGMAMAAVAMAAPAARGDAPEWYHEGVPIGGPGESEALHVIGELSSNPHTGPVPTFVSGPCEVTFAGEAWNANGMAEGVITGGTIQHICDTSVEKCKFTPTLQNFPWTLTGTTVTGEPGVEIAGAQFENHYINEAAGACPLPVLTIKVPGTATGIVDENGCLSFAGHTDDMLTHAPLPTLEINIDGIVCDTTLRLG